VTNCYLSSLKSAISYFGRELFFFVVRGNYFFHLSPFKEFFLGIYPGFLLAWSLILLLFSPLPPRGWVLDRYLLDLALGSAMWSDKWMRVKVLLKHLNRI
jgi:hypothetical protein